MKVKKSEWKLSLIIIYVKFYKRKINNYVFFRSVPLQISTPVHPELLKAYSYAHLKPSHLGIFRKKLHYHINDRYGPVFNQVGPKLFRIFTL